MKRHGVSLPWSGTRDATVSNVSISAADGAGQPALQIALNARGYKWEPHRNKYGRNYPTNAGRERY